MDKFIMFFELFFCSFRTLNLRGSIYRINNHFFSFNRRIEVAISVCDSSFHNENSFNLYYMYLYYKLINTEVKYQPQHNNNVSMFQNDTTFRINK